jgi:thioredoxin-like negative regulator of GroEL
MDNLRRNEFDLVMKSGRDLIILFYQKENAKCTLALETLKEVDALLAKPFDTYIVDVDQDPEISAAFDIKVVPEYISMKQCKIFKRSTDLLYTNQVLDLLK